MIRPPALTAALAAAVALLAAGPALAQRGGRGLDGRGGFADPSAVIAAEIAFNRLAQAGDQWAAFRKTAAKDAVLFTPGAVNAQVWLKGRADITRRVVWWPSRVFMSCDGGYAVSTGGWQQPDGSVGYFTTLWRRDRKGGYRWIINHGDALPALRAAREDDLEAKVAQCDRRSRGDGGGKEKIVPIPVPPPASGEGRSADGTLAWRWDVAADGARTLDVTMLQDGAMRPVIADAVKAPAP